MSAHFHLHRLVLAVSAAGLCASATVAMAADPGPVDVTAAALEHGASASDAAHAGIWKAVSPPGTMHGEFDSNDPIGLSAGKKIKADCSLNWIDPDFGKLYCFSSATSLVFFLDAPRIYLAEARKNWTGLSGVQR
jgi:hypothetical protein